GGRDHGRRWFWLSVAILTVAIFAPLLRSGVVLQLDTPANLVGPYPRASMAVGGPPAELAARVPIDRALAALFTFLPWGWVRLLPLISSVPLAAWGWARCFRGSRLAAAGATVLSVVDPFTYERMVAGQVYLVLAFALMPLLLSLLWEERSARRSVIIGLLIALQVALSLHLVFIAGLLVVAFASRDLLARRWRDGLHLAGSAAIALLASAYWLPSAIRASGGFDRIGTADLVAFRSSADPAFGLYPNLVGLYGFWRHGWVLPKDFLPAWPLFLLALLVVAGIGVAGSWRRLGSRRLAPLPCAGGLGLVLAAGDQGLAGGIYRFLFDHVAVFRVMREPQKWLELLVLVYAVGFGLGLEAIVHAVGTAKARATAAVIVLLIPVTYGFTMLWGFDAAVAPSHYPASWAQANDVMGSGPGAIVALPWHRYLPLPWTQDRVVSNPMVSAFARDVVVSEDPEFGGVPAEGSDPLSANVGQILRDGANGEPVAAPLSRLGVEYLALARVNDWQRWSWLQGSGGIQVVRRWPDLILLQVEQPPG
ncbi:MAG: hypothetical protein QOI81_2089, partial [Actinomycetota bacterium]|nr:hypothetical protein [Actinomycetota bacterium]